MQFFDRIRETESLRQIQQLSLQHAQFTVLTGRRRIGKTYLVREVFQHRFTFQHTGVSNADLFPGTRKRNQLEKFKESLTEAGYNSPEKLKSWNHAFNVLKEVIRHSSERKKAIFPYIATCRRVGILTKSRHTSTSSSEVRCNR